MPVVILVALALRLANVAAVYSAPWFGELQLDHQVYEEWAQRIAAGDWMGSEVFFLDPLYSYVLAVLFKVFGHDLLFVLVMQAGMGGVICYLTALLGRRVFSREVGNGAALVAALFVPAIYYESLIEKTALSVLLTSAALVLFLGRSIWERCAAGVCLGLAVLTRANLLAFVPLGTVLLLGPSIRQLAKRGRPLEKRLSEAARHPASRAALAFAGGALLVLGTVVARNFAVGGELLLTTANAGQNFYIGNNRQNDLGVYRAPPFVRPDPRFEQGDFRREAERRTGRPLKPVEVSDYWFDQAWDEIGVDPEFFTKMLLRKLRLFWSSYEIPDNNNIGLVAEYSWVLRLELVRFGWLVPLALIGAVAGFVSRPKVRILVAFVSIYCGMVIAFFVQSRFRVQVVPILCVLAVAGVVWLVAQLRDRAWGKLGAGVVAALLVAVFCFPAPDWMSATRSLAVSYSNLGAAYAQRGDEDLAIGAYERAVELSPEAATGALRVLGDIYLKRGELDSAERRMRQVVAIKPESRLGWSALVRLYERMSNSQTVADPAGLEGKLAEARRRSGVSVADAATPVTTTHFKAPDGPVAKDPAKAKTHYDLSRQMVKEARWGEAIEHLKTAILLDEYNEGARYQLGDRMFKHADPDEMVSYFRKDVRTDPKPQTSHFFWGLALLKKGDYEGAQSKFRDALEVDPAHELSQLNWGVVLERQGRLEEALEHYREATEIHPEYAEAHLFCARVSRRLGRAEEAEEHERLAKQSNFHTDKRFVYWARYLVKAGRYAAAARELEHALEANPNDQEARALLEEARVKAARAGDSAG